MKIYFAGAIRGGRDDRELYFEIIKELQKYGEVLTEHLGDSKLSDIGEPLSSKEVFERDVAWLHEADVIIAEVTTPSLGVGYEVGLAEKIGKKVLCLFRIQDNRKLSMMIDGNKKVTTNYYSNLTEAKTHIKDFFNL